MSVPSPESGLPPTGLPPYNASGISQDEKTMAMLAYLLEYVEKVMVSQVHCSYGTPSLFF